MAGGVERNLDAVAAERLAIFHRLYCDVAETLAQDRRGRAVAQVDVGAGSRVVAVRMGDHRPPGGAPGIDMKAASSAIEAEVGADDEIHAGRTSGGAPPACHMGTSPRPATPVSQYRARSAADGVAGPWPRQRTPR